MMKHHLACLRLLCLLLMGTGVVQVAAQSVSLPLQVLSSCGDISQVNQASLDWTLGQISVATLQTDQRMLTQGFQQGELRVVRLNLTEQDVKQKLLTPDFSAMVFPNPTQGEVNIHIQTAEDLKGSWQLTDVTGHLLQRRNLTLSTGNTERLNLSDLPLGTYFLHLSTDDQTVSQTYQILKID